MYRFNSGGCCCCCYCDNSDILLLVDTTGSMSTALFFIKENFEAIRKTYPSASCRWALADYKDFEDATDPENPFPEMADGWRVIQKLTNDFDLLVDQIKELSGIGGGDDTEQQFAALVCAADQWITKLGGEAPYRAAISQIKLLA